MIELDEFGAGEQDEMIDEVRYIGASPLTGCVGGPTFVPCSSVGIMECLPPVAPFFPLGRISIEGVGVACIPDPSWEPVPGARWPKICNTTTMTVEIADAAISVTARKGSTASGVAQELATNIMLHPKLFPLVSAVVSGNVITVSARDTGVENWYPWQSSCSYVVDYFPDCAFRAELSPIATLLPQPPP